MRRIFYLVGWLAQIGRKCPDFDYPQTWYIVAGHKRTSKIAQFLCNLFIGHELSETEWGYGGGEYADRWCRWCNKMIQVPYESIYFQFESAREMMPELTAMHCDDRRCSN